MYITNQIAIRRPRQQVIDLMGNLETLPLWQPGLKSVELIRGERGQVGAKSRFVYDMGGFRLEMIETVVNYAPPDAFVSLFEATGVQNRVENRFFADEAEVTRWVMVNNLHFKGLMALMGVFLQETIAKQVRESMSQFKLFAERN